MKLSEAVIEYLVEQSVRGNSKKTVEDYRRKLRFFQDFTGDVELSEITLTLCRSYYLEMSSRLDNSVTVQTYIRALRAFINWLYSSEYISEDICRKFKLPKAHRPLIDVLTDSEIFRIFNCFPGESLLELRNKAVISLMLDAGLRLNEVVTARITRLHLEERVLIVDGKGGKQRAVAFGITTQEILRKYIEKSHPDTFLIIKVSASDVGEPIQISTLKQLFRKLKRRSGVARLHPHLLRHTFATRYLENGGNIYTLQHLLGHTSLEMVKRYLHLATSKIHRDFVNYSPLDRVEKEKTET